MKLRFPSLRTSSYDGGASLSASGFMSIESTQAWSSRMFAVSTGVTFLPESLIFSRQILSRALDATVVGATQLEYSGRPLTFGDFVLILAFAWCSVVLLFLTSVCDRWLCCWRHCLRNISAFWMVARIMATKKTMPRVDPTMHSTVKTVSKPDPRVSSAAA